MCHLFGAARQPRESSLVRRCPHDLPLSVSVSTLALHDLCRVLRVPELCDNGARHDECRGRAMPIIGHRPSHPVEQPPPLSG